MKNTSTEFNTIAENPFGAKYIHKIIDLTNNTEIKDDIDDFLYSAMINDDDVFTIGNTCSATISFSIINPTVNLNNKEIEVYQGLEVNGTIQYIKLGVFKVLKPKKDRSITKYQCVDRMTYLMNMPYSSNLTFPTTDVKILQEICSQVEISLVQNGLISHSISKKPSGYTKREIIAYISQLQGKNARINSDGNLELIWYTDTDYVVDDNKIYYDGTSDINSEIDYKVEYIECTVRSLDGSEENVIKAGTGTNGIKIENPFMTQTILYELANKLVGFTFRGAEFEFLGDFRLEVGDIVSVETNGEVYNVPIMQIEHKSDGGVVTTITSIGETDTENEIDLSAPNVHAMDRYYAELVLINKAMINKLSVDEADIKYLKVTQLEGIEANIENAVIENLEGEFITVEELDAEKARITVLEANSLTSNSAIIKDLQASVTKTNTLIFGSATGGTIQTEFSNSVIAQLGDAQIKSAMIKDLVASKITSGDILTNNVRVLSEDGSLVIADETIQISDDNRVRVQIGKDASNDYSINIWDANGKLMFSEGGITEDAVKKSIIRDDMVSETANISASKLNIASLFEEINGSKETIKSTRVYLDDKAQTLDVAFMAMSDDVSSQGTTLSVLQGQISSKIWQQDIDVVAREMSTKYSTLEQSLDGFKTEVGATYATIDDVDAIEIGGRNLVLNTAKDIVVDGTSSSSNKYTFYEITGVIDVGETYTFSSEITVEGTTDKRVSVRLYNLYGDIGGQEFQMIADGTRQAVTFTVDRNTPHLLLYAGISGATAGVKATYHHIKLEKGNKATDWSPAPEDTESSITTLSDKYTTLDQSLDGISATVASHTTQIASKADSSTVTAVQSQVTSLEANLTGFKTTVSDTYTSKADFNNLQVGGRNLATNTNKGTTGWWWSIQAGNYTASEVVENGVRTCKLTRGTTAQSGWSVITYSYIGRSKWEPNTVYTVSLDVKASVATNFEMQLITPEGTNSIIKSTKTANVPKANTWTKLIWVVTSVDTLPSATGQVLYLTNMNSETGVWYQFKNLKIEKGNKATDWTPAPEDIDTELESTKSIATQTSEMMDWLVESGTSATNFTLTDRMAELTAQIINLNGNVKVSGDMLVDGAITADKLSTDAIKSRNFAIDATTGNITQGMYINLQDGTLNSRYVSWDNKGKLKATSVDLSGNINATTGAIGNWVLDDDGYLYAKTLVGTTTAGTVYKTYLKASSGSYDSVVIGSSIASASNEDSAEWMFRINADGTIITRSQLSVYSADGITTTGPITTTKKMSCNDGCYVNGKTELHGNGLELYYTTPYIDFHYNNSTDDHTARIVENSKGALTVYNTISNASDKRLKQDICSLDKRYLNALNLFKPTSYRFIKGSDNLNLGFLAQDIEKTLLDCGITDLPIVSQDNDGMYALDYNQITALNTLGHLDHEKRIQELENNLAIANALIQSLLLQQSSV